MRIAVTGASGQLGSELHALAQSSGHEFHFWTHRELDIADLKQVYSQLSGKKFDLLINAGAYTQVDAAESNQDLAVQVNALGPKNLCEWAEAESARVVQISTDFVFDGESDRPYLTADSTRPLSVYGQTKRAGEEFCLDSGVSTVIRTSWVYSTFGKNFVKSILRKLEAGEELRVVNDQKGRPTYARNLASFLLSHLEALKSMSGSQIFHFSDEGECTWYEFARKIRDLSGYHNPIHVIASSDLHLAAKRPGFSCLDLTETKKVFRCSMEPWEMALSRMLQLLRTSS